VSQGSMAELTAGTTKTVRVDTDRTEDAVRVLAQLGLTEVRTTPAGVSAILGQVEAAKIVPELVHADVPVLGFTVRSPSLEDVFVSLTGEGFDVSG